MSLQDLNVKFGKDRIDHAKKRLDELAVETPSWGFRRAGTRFERFLVDLPLLPEADDVLFELGEGDRAFDGLEHGGN